MNLTSREKKIISIILNSIDPVTIKSIAKAVDVSSRTILRTMSTIEKWFKTNGVELIKKPRVGIMIKADLEQRNQLLNILNTEKVFKIYSPDERIMIIISELLQRQAPVKLYYFSNYFQVSKATISSDLDTVNQWIQDYNLQLIRKPGLGVLIQGEESDLRKAMINLMYENLNEQEVMNLVKENIVKNKTPEIKNTMLNMINQETMKLLQMILDNVEEQFELDLADSAYIGLLVHLSIALERIKNDENILMDPEFFNELKLSNEFVAASQIAEAIEEQLSITIPKYEIGYITMHLKGSKLRSGASKNNSFLKEDIIGNYELTKMINKMLNEVQKQMGYDFHDDEDLLIGLVSHLRPALSRIKMDMKIRNPLLAEIKDLYPEIYRVSQQCIKILEEWAGITMPEPEIGFIAMHIGAAIEKKEMMEKKKYNVIVSCASGIGTSSLLASKLKKEFKNINILTLASTRKLDNKIEVNNVDFIVSTVEIENIDRPYVVVSPLLMASDKEKINNLIEKLTNTSQSMKKTIKKTKNDYYIDFKALNASIYQLLNNFFLYENIEATNKNDFLKIISEKLFDGEVSNDIYSVLQEREQKGSTLIAEQKILLVHGKSKAIDQIYFGIAHTKDDISDEFYGERVNLNTFLVMLAPKNSSDISIQILNEISKSLIEREGFMALVAEGSEQAVYNEVSLILNDFMKKNLN